MLRLSKYMMMSRNKYKKYKVCIHLSQVAIVQAIKLVSLSKIYH